ncbi:MAG: hypothetical protein JXB32_20315 [Deltaproteobacteria bacterium]|nr:hypothetical protein [Deltaproteobacteria bacterium]
MAVTEKELQRLVKAVRGLPPEVLEELIGLARSLARRRSRPGPRRRGGLAQFAGILHLTEDPLDYQQRVRAEWDER